MRPCFATIIVVAAALQGTPAFADSDHDRARAALRAGEVQPLARALEVVENRFGGHVLDVELEDDDGPGFQYEITLLTDRGRVLKLEMDARTLEILEIEGAERDDD